MELYQLKSFLTIAYEKNLTRAAEALHLSQSALSSQIKLLEEDLGVSLFSRTSRGMAITDQGRILMTHAQDVLETASQLQKRAEEMSRGITATVSIGLNTDPGFLRISATNQRLNRLHNDTNIIFHLCQSEDTPQKLRHGQIDLGFFYGENKDTDIEAVIIRQVRTCVVIPNKFNQEGKDLAWQEVAELPWIWVDNNIPFFKLLQSKIRNYRKLPNHLVTAVDEQIVRELVAAGQGVAIMRDDEARALAENGQVSIWSRGWGEIPLCLGWMAGRGKEKSIQDAREVIEYVWRRPTTATDGSLTDKCWA